MLYGKTKRRAVKTYTKKRYIPRVPRLVSSSDYILCEAAYVKVSVDTGNSSFDVIKDMITDSQDWITMKDSYSEFKVLTVEVIHIPFNVNTTSLSDIANGLMGFREGVYEAATGTFSVANLARFPDVVPYINIRSCRVKKTVKTGEWFHANTTQSADSDTPKITFYISLTQAANTNTNRGFLTIKVKLLARGRIVI